MTFAGNVQSASALVTASIDLRFIDVRDYGAVGDGVHDDSSAIQEAINDLDPIDAGVVLFPAGTYFCATSILVNRDRVYLQGAGKAIIYFAPTAGLLVDGGIAPAANQYFTARDLVFSRFGGLGAGAVVQIKRAIHVRIVDCDFAAGDQSLWLNDVDGAIVRGCFFGELCVGNLLLLTNCLSVSIVENFFENVQPGSGSHIEFQATNLHISIISNRFNDGIQGIRSGVAGVGLFDSAISGNVFTSSCLSGIRIAGGDGPAITGNSLAGSGGAGTGILLEGTSTHATVVGNTVHGYATANINDAGVANVVASNVTY